MSLSYSRDPAALRPQPMRTDPQWWATPSCLIAAMIMHIIPHLKTRRVWEPAAGDDRLGTPLLRAGLTVISTDLFPRAAGIARVDFLHKVIPHRVQGSAGITNPPWGRDEQQLDAFIARVRDGFRNRRQPHCGQASVGHIHQIIEAYTEASKC